jgi:hypothetical protein
MAMKKDDVIGTMRVGQSVATENLVLNVLEMRRAIS